MRKKRFLAVLLAASMVLGNSVMASASSNIKNGDPAEGSAEGSGSVEGLVNKNVFSVELPTEAEGESVFNFIMDPQELVSATDAARYTSANNVVSGSMYFKSVSTDGTYDLGPTSKALTVKNRGTMDVDVTLDAKVDGLSGLELISTNASDVPAFDSGEPSVYLALSGNEISGNGTPEIKPITAGGARITSTISGADGEYDISVSGDKYVYSLSSNSGNFAGYSFALTGARGGGDYDKWTAVEKTTPKVTVTWTLTKHFDPVAPSLTFGLPSSTTNTVAKPATGPIKVKIDWGQGTQKASSIKSVVAASGGTSKTLVENTEYNIKKGDVDFNSDLLQFPGPYMSGVTETTTFTITFDTGDTATLIVTV